MNKEIALVTGGGTGIGQAICKELANSERYIYIHYGGSEEGARETLSLVEAEGGSGEIIQANLKESAEISKMIAYIKDKSSRLDILVNNAGITRDSMTRKMTDEMWNLVIDVNLKGVFNLTRFVGPQMEMQGFGSIVNISSVVGVFGNIGQANYAASKAGVIGMTKTWAKEFARKGTAVRVNAIAPGYVMTDILKTVPRNLLDDFARLTMLGRLGQPEEISKTALFLVSDDASYITGQTINVNGGMRL